MKCLHYTFRLRLKPLDLSCFLHVQKTDKQPQNKKLFTVLQCFVVHLPDWIHIVDILPVCSTNYQANSEYFYISAFAVKNTKKVVQLQHDFAASDSRAIEKSTKVDMFGTKI